MVPNPALPDGWTFEDFCLWMYVLIDELWPQLVPALRRPGPTPRCRDQELVTMAVVGECCGWQRETDLISRWAEHRALFPHQPERSRFHRRRIQLAEAINAVRALVLADLDFALDHQCVLDSLPIPVLTFATSRRQRRHEWQIFGAAFGRVPTKGITIFGYKLYLLVTLNGLIRDFVLAPANEAEVTVGGELLEEHADLAVLGDKAFLSAPLRAHLRATCGVRLTTLPRRNQQPQVPAAVRHTFAAARRVIETVVSQLAEQFHIETTQARTFSGLCARLLTKLTAHTLCVALNRRLGRPEVLQIKALAFPPAN